MSRYWFKPRRYGLGAAPSSWEGWALTVAYALAVTSLGAWLMDEARANAQREQAFFAALAVLTVAFIVIVWRKTEGGWRWRWGADK
ncbi:MAG: hypothetical protein JNJ63_06180 [Hyphomonadaceae bacterium]|nr:hypothetical protein [Hyphomonadaceae bacterium]